MNVGVLDQFSHELVVDRLMALDASGISISHIKWVVLMVVSNQSQLVEIADWAEVVVSAEDLIPVIH
jgi:uncharacterized protein Smg (DUF494 family)